MSPIPIHTQSPISAAKAPTSTTTSTSEPKPSTHPPAQPGAVASIPTKTVPVPSNYGPPSPQPGAIPTPSTSTTIAKPSLPPPPKAGEKPEPPEYYAPVHAAPTHTPQQARPYPNQMSLPAPSSTSAGQPPASTTNSNQAPSYPQSTYVLPSSQETQHDKRPPATRVSPDHPPGYMQNPYATDMTSQQRLAQDSGNQSTGEYNPDRRPSSDPGFGQEESMWDMAKNLAKGVGEKVSEINKRYGGG